MANLYGYNSSSAHKLEYDYDRRKGNEKKQLRTSGKVTKTVKTVKRNPAKTLASFLKVAVCFAVAFAIVNGYVKINEATSEIAKLESDAKEIEARNDALKMKINKAFDSEQLQIMAAEKYGMVRPEQHQTFYVDMEQEDFAETTGEDGKTTEQTTVKGVTGTMTGTLNIFN